MEDEFSAELRSLISIASAPRSSQTFTHAVLVVLFTLFGFAVAVAVMVAFVLIW